MTGNQIAYKQAKIAEESNRIKKDEVQEKKRSNRSQERLTRRGQNLSTGTNIVSGLAKLAGSINDISWYNKDKQLLQDVARISMHTPLGGNLKTTLGSKDYTIPGIMVIGWVPSIGNTNNMATSNVANVAATQIYSYVRHANSGSRNYESKDLMMYLISVDQAYSYWAKLRRIYSLGLTYKAENRYYYKAMLAAEGVDPNEVVNRLSELRAYINSFALRVNALYVPNAMPIYERHVWLNSNIFKDQPVKKSQEYMFVQRQYLTYDDINGVLASVHPEEGVMTRNLIFIPGANHSLFELMNFGNYIINSLLESEDIGIMSGDILKAYGESQLHFLPTTSEDYHIESMYSEEVLSQINQTICHKIPVASVTGTETIDNYNYDKDPIAIKQDSKLGLYQGHILYPRQGEDEDAFVGVLSNIQKINHLQSYNIRPDGSSNLTNIEDVLGEMQLASESINKDMPCSSEIVINMYKDNVTPEEIMISSRLATGFNVNVDSTVSVGYTSVVEGDGYVGHALSHYATEIADNMYIIQTNANQYSASASTDAYKVLVLTTYMSIPNSSIGSNFEFLYNITRFDWHPRFERISIDIGSFNSTSNGRSLPMFDTANTAAVSYQTLDNLHYVALLSEFGVPDLGMKVRTR